MAVEFEVAEPGMERQVPWRYGQRQQRDARQLQAGPAFQWRGLLNLTIGKRKVSAIRAPFWIPGRYRRATELWVPGGGRG